MTSILTTRPVADEDPLVGQLEALGYRTLAVPAVALEPVAPGGDLDAAVARLGDYDWAVVTSATGARVVVAAARRLGSELRDVRWAAVGPATASVLVEAGVAVEVQPAVARGAAIADAIEARSPLRRSRVLLARADAAEAELPARLRAAGAAVDEVVAYHTVEGPPASRPAMRAALADPDLAAIVVASGSAIRGLVRLLEDDRAARAALVALPLISIGPSTSGAIRAAGLSVAAEAPSASVEGLVRAVASIVPFPSTAESMP